MGDAVFDPQLDIGPSVAECSAGPEADGSFSPVAPCVQGLDWNVEKVGEFFCGEETVEFVHGRIMRVDPFSRVSFRCHSRCSLLSVIAGGEVVLAFTDVVSDLQLEGSLTLLVRGLLTLW